MSINTVEFSRNDTDVTANSTLVQQPGKFIVDIDCTTLGCGSSRNLLNDVSSQNSPISVLLNVITATGAQTNLNLILNYDALVEIDPSTSMESTKV